MNESKVIIDLKKKLEIAEAHLEKVKAELYSTLGNINSLRETIDMLGKEPNNNEEKKG